MEGSWPSNGLKWHLLNENEIENSLYFLWEPHFSTLHVRVCPASTYPCALYVDPRIPRIHMLHRVNITRYCFTVPSDIYECN